MPPPSYPAQISAVIDRSRASLPARAALDAYAANPHLRSSPTFEFLHFAVIGKYEVPNEQAYEEEVARSAGLEIRDSIRYEGSTFEGNLKLFYRLFDVSLLGLEPQDEPEWLGEVLDEPWNVIDVDLEDANGVIFRTRILYNNGNADVNSGFFGKVYDRADDMRVLANIEGFEGDCETRWVPEPGVAASFAEHAHLGDLPSLFAQESLEPGGCDCQFTALLALALYTVRIADRNPRGGPSSTASALSLMRTMLRSLANPSSAAHAENTVVQVLCSDGLPLETICTFACGRYPILVEGETFDAEGGPGALDWLLRENLPAMQATRYHRAGDAAKAMAAFGEWDEEEEGEIFSTYCGRERNVDECIALAEQLSLGLADNEDFWSWIARHSPLVREKAWFKRETIEELVTSQDSDATEKDMVETQAGTSQADADEVKEGTQQEACTRVEQLEAASRVALFDQLKDLEQVAGELSEVPTLVAQLQSGSDDAKAEAAATLQNLAVNDDNKVAIAKEDGALAALVALLRNGSAVGKENAARALQLLARNDDNRVAIAKEEGALTALVALLSEGGAVGKEYAAGALANLSFFNTDNQVAIAKEEGALAALVALLREGSAVGKENAAGALTILAHNDDNEVAIAKEEGALAALVALLREGSAVGKEKAAAALLSLTHNADNEVAIAKEEGALAALVALLREGSAAGKEKAAAHAAAALQNLAANADNQVVIAKEKGALAALVALLREGNAESKENAAGALWGLAVSADNKVAIAKEEGALAALVVLVREGSAVGKETAAGALWNLAINDDNRVAIAKEEGALAALVALLREGSAMGKENAAAALWYLAVNDDNQVAIAKEEGALAALVALLREGSAVGKKYAAAALANLSAKDDNKVAIAREEGALAALVALLREGSAAGKEKAAEAVKFLSRNIEIKNRLLQLDCPASALA